MTTQPVGRAGPCPACGADTLVPIIYGFPDVDAYVQSEAGEVVLGGCVIMPDHPTHQCTSCGNEVIDPSTPPGGTMAKRRYEIIYIIEAEDDDEARLAADAARYAIADHPKVDLAEANGRERAADGSIVEIDWKGWRGRGRSFSVSQD